GGRRFSRSWPLTSTPRRGRDWSIAVGNSLTPNVNAGTCARRPPPASRHARPVVDNALLSGRHFSARTGGGPMQTIPVTAALARPATALAWRDLPEDLVERTKQCLLDWFAVTIAGAQEELTEILVREAIEDGAKGRATLVGRSEKVVPSSAALINGAA